jgi:hypothetical protein
MSNWLELRAAQDAVFDRDGAEVWRTLRVPFAPLSIPSTLSTVVEVLAISRVANVHRRAKRARGFDQFLRPADTSGMSN